MKLAAVILLLGTSSPIAAQPSHKPTAPIDVELTSVAVRGGFAVTLVATPTRDVPEIVLELTGAGPVQRVRFGAARAGSSTRMTIQVPFVHGTGIDVVGSATAGRSGLGIRNRAAVLHVGPTPAAAVKRDTIITLPDGRVISETR